MSDLLSRITIQDGKRSGRPCIRGMRIAVHDILGWMAAGMTDAEILSDYDELEPEDLRAALLYAAKALDHSIVTVAAA
ncbi:DUF433 domain-containing protein [Brevundimonas sp. VNH65]|uniref:DUF433 domain-containing protein n=1 Tax=Brevundimonas sp. VNH65 TaxID=3400917 RepID=UPI003C113DE7